MLLDQILKLSNEEIHDLINTLLSMITIQLCDLKDIEHCPHCSSTNFIKHGIKNDKQRFKCKVCNKTFSKNTNTIFAYTKINLDVWKQFIYLMFSDTFYSLDNLSNSLNLSKKTVFYMRHRICDLMGACCNNTLLSGVIEADEMYDKINHKGHKNGDNSRKRGGKPLQGKGKSGVSAGLGSDKVCILTLIDSNKNLYMEKVKLGKIDKPALVDNISKLIIPNSIYCSDGDLSHIAFAKDIKVEHKIIRVSQYHNTMEYHVNNINNLHSQYNKWIYSFQGVSTKYLQSYLNWFMFIFKSKKDNLLNKINIVINKISKQRIVEDIYNQPRYI